MTKTTLDNLLAGVATGFAGTIDPIGYSMNYQDRWITGAGSADKERAIPTFYAKTMQSFYDDYKEKQPFLKSYVPRFAGNILGSAGGVGALYGTGKLLASVLAKSAPGLVHTTGYAASVGLKTVGAAIAAEGNFIGSSYVAALGGKIAGYAGAAYASAPVILGAALIPAALGVYAAGATIYKIATSFINGEGKNKEKGSFMDGMRFGWHNSTYMPLFRAHHDLEADLTGRGLPDSHIESRITESSGAIRRNFASVAGGIVGAIGGGLATLCTFGLLNVYKSFRDWYRTAAKKPYGRSKPAISAA